MRTTLLVILLLFLLGCGGAAKTPEEAPSEAPKAVWEDNVDDAAYKFYRSVSRTLLRTNQPERAVQTIRRLFRLKPGDPEPRYLMGQAYVAMGQYESALRMFDDALDKDDEYAPAYSMKGRVLNSLGEHADATETHKKAIELEEENPTFHNNLGFSYYLQGKYKEAVDAYLKALDIDPGAKRIHNNVGFAYGKLGDVSSARNHFQLAGLPAQVNNNMGFVFETRGELEKAYEYYLIALQQNPHLVQAKENLLRVCDRLGRAIPESDVTFNEEEGEAVITAVSASPDL